MRTYASYLEGDVYGYVVKHKVYGLEESCWGFYGMDYCKSEATSVADGIANEVERDLGIADSDTPPADAQTPA